MGKKAEMEERRRRRRRIERAKDNCWCFLVFLVGCSFGVTGKSYQRSILHRDSDVNMATVSFSVSSDLAIAGITVVAKDNKGGIRKEDHNIFESHLSKCLA